MRLLRGAGLFLGGVLAAAAILSVASAIRLALDLHREEIEIMRLMGATEAAIRAPFWLYASAEGLARRNSGTAPSCMRRIASPPPGSRATRTRSSLRLWVRFLDAPTALLLPLTGLAAGFLASLLSMGRK